jgi:hypothetical protein
MPVRHKMIWYVAGWLPYTYGFCPSKRTWDRLRASSKRDLGPYPDNAATTTFFQNRETKKPIAVVTVGDRPPPDTVGLLVHEAMHVWRDIREGIGEMEPSSEFEAYAVQNIVGELFEAYRKTRGPLFIRQRP